VVAQRHDLPLGPQKERARRNFLFRSRVVLLVDLLM
jgi:hypothetical protein